MDSVTLKEKIQGALLGTFAGDALGMPVEGWAPEEIRLQFGVLDTMKDGRLGRGSYTDDTEMMIALAETLVRDGNLAGPELARAFLENYHPERGYGPGTVKVLGLLGEGVPWEDAATRVYPQGSFGNGCAMRAAPIGCFYYHDEAALRDAAFLQSRVTHAHPLAQAGSFLQAYAVARLLGRNPEEPFDPLGFLSHLAAVIPEEAVSFERAFERIEVFLRGAPGREEVIDRLGHDSRVIRSQPTALYAFLSHHRSFEDAVVYAVSLGGDADTLGAMTGALAGAYHGVHAIPRRWWKALENTSKGRDYIAGLAERLADLAAGGG